MKFSVFVFVSALMVQSPAFGQYTVMDENPGGPTASTVKPVTQRLYPSLEGNVQADAVSVSAGSRFRVNLITPISSETATIGDTVTASLVDPLTVNGVTVANKGDILSGQVTDLARAERTIKSYLPKHHFLDPEGRIGLTFLTITDGKGNRTPISAVLAPQTDITCLNSSLKLIVNKDNEAEVKSITTRYLIADAALAGGLIAAGPIGLAVAPAVTGIAGAISPAYAHGHQVEAGQKQSRVKDFLLGASRGVPGGFLVAGVTTRGEDVNLHNGDQMVLEFNQDALFNR